jgi:hypothetical protein
VRYDPRDALRALEEGSNVATAWEELWNELHHQGDVGEESYAAIPHLVRIHELRGVADWNTYGMVGVIEEARRARPNPELPAYLQPANDDAWRGLVRIVLKELEAATDPTLVSSIIGVVATAKGERYLARFASDYVESERKEILESWWSL